MKDWNPSPAERAARYRKARITCQAPRGWEPWLPWEDAAVRNLVEFGQGSIRQMARISQRTENAILCRIEKRYGQETRDEWANITSAQQRRAQAAKDFIAKADKWDWFQTWDFPPGWMSKVPPCVPDTDILNAMLGTNQMPFNERYMHHSDDAMRDAEIFSKALREIQEMNVLFARQCHPMNGALDTKRWAYRVTPAEYRAIGREIQRRQFSLNITGEAKLSRSGNYFASITLCGVRLSRSFEPVAPVIKDYGTSG